MAAQINPTAQSSLHPLTLLRAQRRLSIRELSRLTRVSRTTLARVERGHTPNFSIVLAIAAAIDCDVDLLEALLQESE